MFSARVRFAACTARRSAASGIASTTAPNVTAFRTFASVSPVNPITPNHKVLVIGGGPAGLSISHKLLRSGKFAANDIAVADPASTHDYQPGWTLVGGGLKTREELRRPIQSLIDPKIQLYSQAVDSFSPKDNRVTLKDGGTLEYDHLVVAPGISVNFDSVKGLPEALADP